MPRFAFRIALLAIPAVLLVAIVGAACGGGSTTTGPAISDVGGTGSGASPALVGVNAIPVGAPEINQDNSAFKPSKLTVKAGEKVYFRNSEAVPHTVTINGKNESRDIKKGAIFAWTVPQAGQYKITCDYHPQMKATITVE
jgi:plastocyanin